MSESSQKGMPKSSVPDVRPIGWHDIAASLRSGIGDFFKAPKYGLLFGAVYALGGLAILALLIWSDMPWMILLIGIGFPLVGPFVAAGLYEVSRKLAAGENLTWRSVLFTVFSQRERQLGWMAFVVLFIFWIWVYQVRILIAIFLGFNTPSTIEGFVQTITTTGSGLMFLSVGTLVGAFLAMVLFSATVIAMPMLLDSEKDFVSAIIASFQSVFRSPIPMLGWGVIVTLSAIVAMLPAFLGLIVVFPILGHATWHLYTRAVVRDWRD